MAPCAMRRSLVRHPMSPCPAVTGVEVEASRAGPGRLALRYILTGAVGELALPPAAAPERADGLWRTTCFEAFVQDRREGYREFNFSPSGRWAAYRFTGYRAGMAEADVREAPRIKVAATAVRLELSVELEAPEARPLRLGLSAVIQTTDGHLSYWALAHPPGKADFHHADGFALTL